MGVIRMKQDGQREGSRTMAWPLAVFNSESGSWEANGKKIIIMKRFRQHTSDTNNVGEIKEPRGETRKTQKSAP